MLRSTRALLLLATGTALAMGGCGKPPPPKVDAAKEQAEANARARERAYGGEAVKALDQAKGMQEDMNKKALESVDKAEKGN
ncbi:hypothetical protein BWI17_17065 [Betaproteobacteria bacterium GR16-43]|nr:hypothetical protein BWI17_17065 [Betaproteobacteria bacterium GR16-43]